MNITVCFKIAPDFEQALDGDWDNFSFGCDLSYVKKDVNCFDEAALELALRLKDADSSVRCAALSVCADPPAGLIKRLFAAGFDEIERIPANVEFNPELTATLLAGRLSELAPDLILTGRQAGCADTGATPILLAEYLSLPIITEVTEIGFYPGEPGAFMIKADTDFGPKRFKAEPPFTAAIGNSTALLRIPTLARQMAVAKKRIINLPVGREAASAIRPCLSRPKSGRRPQFLEFDCCLEAAEKIWEIL